MHGQRDLVRSGRQRVVAGLVMSCSVQARRELGVVMQS